MANQEHILTAEAVWLLIDFLPPAEQQKFFELVAVHPHNEFVMRLRRALDACTNTRLVSEELLRRLADEAGLDELERNMRQLHNQVAEVVARYESTRRKAERYQKGPKAKAAKSDAREDLVRQYVKKGIENPIKILELLKQNAPELAIVGKRTISTKTIKNLVCHVKKIQCHRKNVGLRRT